MEEHWFLDSIEIHGGFLQNIDLSFPPGLCCIIGPRGSGKSTLAEALRFGMTGLDNAERQRVELFKSNLSKAVVTLRTRPNGEGNTYVIRREGRQQAVLTTDNGRALSSVDLDRGTFLPFEGYTSMEVEDIAVERLGPKRRSLLDDLRPAEMQKIQEQLSASSRDLASNADAIRAARRRCSGLNEQIQALSDARDRLALLPSITLPSDDTVALQEAARQRQRNKEEQKRIQVALEALTQLADEQSNVVTRFSAVLVSPVEATSSRNQHQTLQIEAIISQLHSTVLTQVMQVHEAIKQARTQLAPTIAQLNEAHLQQDANYALLREKNQALGEAMRERAEAEDAVRSLEELEQANRSEIAVEAQLLNDRRAMRANYMQLCESVSQLRETIAGELESEAGGNVRLRVRRNADNLEYQQTISEGLHGAGVRNHDSIIESITRLRPDELAQLLRERNYYEFETICELGGERSRRVMDALRVAIDPLELEVLRMEDVIIIELNIGSDASPVYKDASELSRGQKCTALLPILLARRHTPLVIDQPEDNLDNHFIFRTVVESIQRLKNRRQMIFITHNANIPVLAEADLIVVMGSDGRTGYIEKQGSLDECQQEIIDLLEGGPEAFEKRRQRYARK
jgi:ABC-type cobalamin/Fe3+-siderophores transport system ATPase subunit